MAEDVGTKAFNRQQSAIIGRADSRPSLSVIACPTLVLVGESDQITPLEHAQAMFETNVWGPARMVQALAPGMRARSRGAIVNVTSLAGRAVAPLQGYYAASKWALEALSEAMDSELRHWGIRVIVIEPQDPRRTSVIPTHQSSLPGSAPERGGRRSTLVAMLTCGNRTRRETARSTQCARPRM